MRARALFLALACATGCARASTPEERTLAILEAHGVPDADASGHWEWSGHDGPVALAISRAGGDGRVEVRYRVRDAATSERTVGTLDAGVLTLAVPVAGSTRFHCCRFDAADLLVAETGVSFADELHPVPAGVVFFRLEVVEPDEAEWLRSFSGPDDEDVDGGLGDE